MTADRHYVRGSEVYPGGQWDERNRPDPTYCLVYFPPMPKHTAVDYPPSLAKEVAKANRLSELAVFTPIALGHADPRHLFDTLSLVHHGEVSLGIYRASEGYTKTARYGDEGGFVLNAEAGR